MSPEDKESLENLAYEFGCMWGDNPNISELIKKIACGAISLNLSPEPVATPQKPKKPHINKKDSRSNEMAELLKNGATLEAVGKKFSLSRERVRQILTASGYKVSALKAEYEQVLVAQIKKLAPVCSIQMVASVLELTNFKVTELGKKHKIKFSDLKNLEIFRLDDGSMRCELPSNSLSFYEIFARDKESYEEMKRKDFVYVCRIDDTDYWIPKASFKVLI